jgi:hypothetical protein
MTTEEKIEGPALAMSFYHQDGLPAAWKNAAMLAGKGGRIATLPDIIEARLKTKPGDLPWETYYTTLTAEYFGIGSEGKPILIVAHGIGPMSTLEGIQKAYSHEYKDKDRNQRGGRISQQEFLDLEVGKFGTVEIIDFEDYCSSRKYPFHGIIRSDEAILNPLLKARLGSHATEYIKACTNNARQWHEEQSGITPKNKYSSPEEVFEKYVDGRKRRHILGSLNDSDPYIVEVGSANNCMYHVKSLNNNAIAHLISIGNLAHVHHEGNESLSHDIDCHEWWNGTRIVGIQGEGLIDYIASGPDADQLFKDNWLELFKPVKNPEEVGFRALMNIKGQWFTQYLKKGEGTDEHAAEYAVTKIKKIGKPTLFRTDIRHYHAFFKYGIKEVQAIAPKEANAYSFVSEVQNEYKDGNPVFQTAMVQFYNVTVNNKKRLMRVEELARNYELMMKLKEEDD